MGRSHRKHHRPTPKSHTLPSSPTHSFTSSSSSDFEFTISLSPHKSSAALCPADELFYKGQLLPLHLSPRLSMVRTLLLSSSSTSSSSDTTTTASRDSTASHSSSDSSADLLHHHVDCDSSRPSSATDEEFKRLPNNNDNDNDNDILSHVRKSSKYFSLAKFSSVFRKENRNAAPSSSGGAASVKRVSSSAKEVLRKYLKKVKPLYEKLSQKQQQQQQKMSRPAAPPPTPPSSSRISRSASTTICLMKDRDQEFITGINYSKENSNTNISQSFSGNLRYPKRGSSYISSCPSSMMSSPRHGDSGFGFKQMGRAGAGLYNSDASSMEELQSAIQGAIAHCKNSMLKNKNTVSNEI